MELMRMKQLLRLTALAFAPLVAVGCQSTGLIVDFPPIGPVGVDCVNDQNPVYIALSPGDYGRLFETVLQTLDDYRFEVGPGDANRYDGRIEALPRVSPGLGFLLKP